MRRLSLALLLLSAVISGLFSPSLQAASPKNKGLLISPLRSYVALDADTQVTRSLTIANLTDQPLTVSLAVEQFSVADYAYDFRFSEVDNDWLRLIESQATLKPNESHQFPYLVSIPKGAAPGGHYYTLFASASVPSGGFASTVQAASLLYVTVNGNLKRTSDIQATTAPRIVFSPTIPYSIDVKNTGNIHYFAYFSAEVSGLFYHSTPTGASQLLMPGTTRRIQQTTPSPFLPGFYTLIYGFTPDKGERIERTQYFLFIPPWFVALLFILGFLAFKLLRRRKRKRA